MVLLPNRLKRPAKFDLAVNASRNPQNGARRSLQRGERPRADDRCWEIQASASTPRARAPWSISPSSRLSRQPSAAPKSTGPAKPRNWPFPIRHRLDPEGSRRGFATDGRTEASEASMQETLVKPRALYCETAYCPMAPVETAAFPFGSPCPVLSYPQLESLWCFSIFASERIGAPGLTPKP